MSILPSFRKPAWQSGNAERRLAIVTEGTQPDLVAALPHLAIEDEVPAIRREALRRCDDPALFQRAMTADVDGELRRWARQRWLAAVQAGQLDPQAIDFAALPVADLELIATGAGSPDIRAQALAACTRPGFLFERALADPDPALRLLLADRIQSPDQLDRLAERARSRDKHLARQARERSQALRLQAGDADASRRRAEALCAGLEGLMRSDQSQDRRALSLARAELDWQALGGDRLPEDLGARFQGAVAVLQQQLQGPPAPTGAPGTTATAPGTDGAPAAAAEAPAASPAAAAPTPEQILAQARMQAELAATAAALVRERALEQERQQQQQAQIQVDRGRLDQLEQALSAGDLVQARTLARTLDAAGLTRDPDLGRRWQVLQPQLKSLAGWQRWAAGEARARLCEGLEALVGSSLHPDALAGKVREAQQAWRQLEAEPTPAAGSPAAGLERRFRAACAQVLKPAKGYFDKRDALRRQRATAIEAFLAAGLPAVEQADLAALLERQRTATGHLRDLGELAPAQRKALAARLRQFLDALRPGIDQHFQAAETGRQELIQAAAALAQSADPRRAASEGRLLQQRWKALPPGRQARDQQQWRQFRKALDEVFATVDQQRRHAEGQRQSRASEANRLIAELEALAGAAGEALTEGQARVRELRTHWQALAVTDQQLTERFDNALTRHRDSLRSQQRDSLRAWALAEIAAGAPAAPIGSPAALASARDLLFEVEALAGLDSPESEHEARRMWQLQRLQQHMRGERPTASGDALPALLARWRQIVGLAAADRAPLAERLARAVERYVAHS